MLSKLGLTLSFWLMSVTMQAQQPLRRAFQPANEVNKVPYGANARAGHTVQTNDAKIYYEVYRKGQPIVLLHGGLFGSTIEVYSKASNLYYPPVRPHCFQ